MFLLKALCAIVGLLEDRTNALLTSCDVKPGLHPSVVHTACTYKEKIFWFRLELCFDEDEGEEQFVPTSAGRKRLFSKELRCMMYGFGDDKNPYTESVDLLEDLVIEFITEMTHKAMEIGRTGRVQVEDIIFLVRKDPRKYARVKDLLTMNEELKKARKAFDEIKYVGQCGSKL
uniref:Transcription initiation factor TFIID subunit 13 n=1 Tax=Glossina palpalis gambiensis TaxID=67801 RepID=A0A1B0C698_9MUSC